MQKRSALVMGATGLIGSHCLELLLADDAYERVVAPVRRPLGKGHPKLEQHIVEFDHLDDFATIFGVDDIFCCLGTTIKRAGSQEAFRRVDLDYVIRGAELGLAAGAKRVMAVSAMGADSASKIFYNRIKGQMEDKLRQLDYESVNIMRPSLLLGRRPEFRLAEELGKAAMKFVGLLMVGPLKDYRAIEGSAVAAAMIEQAKNGEPGVNIIKSGAIRALAA